MGLIITRRTAEGISIFADENKRTRWHPSHFAIEIVQRLTSLWDYRELIHNLVIRDLKVRYKNSVFGFAWSLLNPLFMMIVLSVVFRLAFGSPTHVKNFPAFLIAGLIPWNFTSTSLARGVSSIVEQSNLIKKVYFPREALPISVVLANFLHFLLAIPVLLLILMVLGVMPNPIILILPLIIIIHLILVVGILMLISCVNVFYRDMGVALDVLLQAWFFATPIMYPHSILPIWLQKPAMGNPLAAIITAYRDILIFGRFPDRNFTLVALASSVLVFIVGYAVFIRYANRFAEEV